MNRKAGYTVVELLIVIVVIAILASLVIISYTGIRNEAHISLVKETGQSISKQMELFKIRNSTYPSEATDLTHPEGIGIAITSTGDATTFCINISVDNNASMRYSIQTGNRLIDSFCDGDVISATPSYHNEISTPQTSTVNITTDSDTRFTLTTAANWSYIDFKWDAIDNAQRYQLNHRTSFDGEWVSRDMNNSSGYSYAWDALTSGRTGNIPQGTTSLRWTRTERIPQNYDQTHQYRFRYQRNDNTFSDWNIITLSPAEHMPIKKVPNFAVAQNQDHSNITFSWGQPDEFGNMPGARIVLNVKGPDEDSPWVTKDISNSYNYSYAWDATSSNRTGAIPITSTSLTWTNTGRFPKNYSEVFQYRIAYASGSLIGPWTTITRDHQSIFPVPGINNFQIAVNSTDQRITFSWDSLGNFIYMPGARIVLNQRTSPTAEWVTKDISALYNYSYDWDAASSGRTGAIPIASTSLTWSSSVRLPPIGGSHEYRITAASGNIFGPWSYATASR